MSATAGHFIGETHTRSERVGCTNHGELRRMAHISCTAQPSRGNRAQPHASTSPGVCSEPSGVESPKERMGICIWLPQLVGALLAPPLLRERQSRPVRSRAGVHEYLRGGAVWLCDGRRASGVEANSLWMMGAR